MSDPTFNSVTISRPSAGQVTDLLTLDAVDGADGTGAALRFVNNSSGTLSFALGRIGAYRADASTVRLDLGVALDPSVTSSPDTLTLLSLEKGAGAPVLRVAAGSLLDVGGRLEVRDAARLAGLEVAGSTALNGALTVAGALRASTIAIGTASPLARLHLHGGRLRVSESDGANGSGVIELANGGKTNVVFTDGPTGNLHLRTDSAGHHLLLQSGGQQGNVGVGTAAPTHKFHVLAPEAVGLFESSGSQAFLRLSTAEGLGNRVEITNRPGGRLSLWTAGGGDVFNITRDGLIGIGLTDPRTPVHVRGRIATGLDFNSPGAVTFYPPDGAAWFHIDNGPAGGRPTGRLRISHGVNPGTFELISILQTGNIGIGTTTPGTKLHIIGNRLRLENGNRIVDLRADGSAVDLQSQNTDLCLNLNGLRVVTRNLWYDTLNRNSSREYKQDVAPYPPEEAAWLLPAITPVSFRYKADPTGQGQLGFIAEDLPEAVASADGRGVRIDNLLAVLVAVVRQQQQALADLRAEVAALRTGT